ncbi:MAG TPA: hypothetical protein PKW35_05930, partial [Nannocystaceae bacterium]|nr:hypothetical protein [Nannocystaceae bacterium]
ASEAGHDAGAFIEGMAVARRVASHIERAGLVAPLLHLTADVLEGRLRSEAMVASLMARQVGDE